mmetsp:Transcript_14037/g.33955  ORF Transcript_14037/g.33955 Transcript_14037/m.33955 type:complete len:246 (+) Transcript_14037:410-1147(+)
MASFGILALKAGVIDKRRKRLSGEGGDSGSLHCSSVLSSLELDHDRSSSSSDSSRGLYSQKPWLLESFDPSDSIDMDLPVLVLAMDMLLSMLTSKTTSAAHCSVSSRSPSSTSQVSELESDAEEFTIPGSVSSFAISWRPASPFVAWPNSTDEATFLILLEARGVPRRLLVFIAICSVRALDAAEWCHLPFSIASSARSAAMENRASNLDGNSPRSSFRQHMHAISYRVRPLLIPSLSKRDDAQK